MGTRIVNLEPGRFFMYSSRKYRVLAGVEGEGTRFRIQEATAGGKGYTKRSDQVYVYCYDTGQLGSFEKDTGVRPMPVSPPLSPLDPPPAPPTEPPQPLGESGQSDPAPDQEKQMTLVLDLFNNVVAKQTFIDDKIKAMDELAEERDQAEDAFNASRNALWVQIERLEKVPVGYYVVNGYIVRIMTNSLALFKVENA